MKLLKLERAVVAFKFSRGAVSLCQQCAAIVERDGGEIKGCTLSGYPLDPNHPWYALRKQSLRGRE
jgi:hypothetical protein